MSRQFIAIAFVACLVGCAGHRGRQAEVGHVVVCWLKEPGNEAQRRQLIEKSAEFRKIPGVVSVRAGRAIASPRPVVDSSYDVAVIMLFKDAAAQHTYDTHPIHVAAVKEALGPLTAKILIYDVALEE